MRETSPSSSASEGCGSRDERRAGVEQAEQRAHLPDRLLAGRADRAEHLAGAGGIAFEHPLGGADL